MNKKKQTAIYLVIVLLLLTTAAVSADGMVYQQPVYQQPVSQYQPGTCYPGPYCGSNCCNPVVPVVTARDCAIFVSDVTIPDGSYVAPGSSFVKTWRIRNNGNTVWNTNYRLVFYTGTQMAVVSSVNFPYNVAPGQTMDISVPMTAPSGSGVYQGSWMLMNDVGRYFGVGSSCSTAIWVQIATCYYQPYNPCYGYSCCNGYYCNPGTRPQPQPRPYPVPQPGPWNDPDPWRW